MVKIVFSKEEANCITHSGTMHADEVFATAFLELYKGDVSVFRTTTVGEVDDSVLVYDIGRGKYDHHQIDAEKRDNGITYSSFGLLWREFGKSFLEKNDFSNIDDLWNEIDKDLVEGIDADDNGFFPKIEANYRVKTLPNVIKLFNPSFDSGEDESTQFLKAVNLAKTIIEEEIYYVNGKVIASHRINEIIEDSDPNSKYLILDEFLPYEEAILNNPNTGNLLFVAFPSNRGGYAIKTLPKSLDDKTARMPFPEEWAGLQDKELESVSKIPGLRFCHTARFIVSCNTIECVYQVLDLLCK